MTKVTKILTIANRKGGAGKSTSAAHIALEAVSAGLKILLIDLDPQKTLENWWKKRDSENPALTDIDSTDLQELQDKVSKHGFDLCIIDTPGDTSQHAINALKVADLVLIPTKPTGPDLEAVGRTITYIKKEDKPYLFVVTQATSGTKSVQQAMGALSSFGEVIPTTLVNRVSYSKAMVGGISAGEIDKSAKKELNEMWHVISNKLFGANNKEGGGNEKAKVQLG